MSDDLVERLRKMSPTLDILECEDVLQAADRIEELESAFANISREYDKRGDRIEELEAKLEAALEQMQRVKDFRYDPNIGVELNMLEAILAKIKGEADE